MTVLLLNADCREEMPRQGLFDLIMADPPYGDTALEWDRKVRDWEAVALRCLKPTGSMWVFGSMRYFLDEGLPAGWRYAQDLVWEKPAGTGFAADRFRRVHEHVVQFYPKASPWGEVHNDVQRVPYFGPDKHVRARAGRRGQHLGAIGATTYEDSGDRIVRSVIQAPSIRGGVHPTQKPTCLLETIIRTSCPPGGLVGDFFAGSAAVGEACIRSGRRYVGCEIDPEMARKATLRLAGVTLPLPLGGGE